MNATWELVTAVKTTTTKKRTQFMGKIRINKPRYMSLPGVYITYIFYSILINDYSKGNKAEPYLSFYNVE